TELCPTLGELIGTRRAVGETGRIFENLSALSTVNNLDVLCSLMLSFRPSRTLEIGLSFGGSALLFCAMHKKIFGVETSQHIALDPFQTEVWDSCGLLALRRAQLNGCLEFREKHSSIELPV